MTIATILSQGNAIQLGPVTIEKTYDKKPGDKNRFLLISDPSGKGALKIWGAAANTNLVVGQQITLIGFSPKGGLKTSEYNGKTSIDANDCRIEIAGANPAGQASASQGPGGHTDHSQASVEHVGYGEPEQVRPVAYTASATQDKLPLVMKRCATATALYVDELVVNHGYSKDEALMLAQNAPSWWPLFWFGEKGLA